MTTDFVAGFGYSYLVSMMAAHGYRVEQCSLRRCVFRSLNGFYRDTFKLGPDGWMLEG